MVKHLTKEGFENLKKELEQLKTVSRKEVQERIRRSAALGDLKENAGYHAAKEDQSFIEGRILQLQDIINQAQTIEKKPSRGVQIGSVVYPVYYISHCQYVIKCLCAIAIYTLLKGGVGIRQIQYISLDNIANQGYLIALPGKYLGSMCYAFFDYDIHAE